MNASEYIEQSLNDGMLTIGDLGELVKVAQRALGVKPDGKPGAATLAALPPAVPANRRAVEATYGPLTWHRPDPDNRHVVLDEAWIASNIKLFTLHDGKRVRLHKLIGDEFVALFKRACDLSGYHPAVVQTFVQRTIGISDRLSMHAFGLAVDFDPKLNWLGGYVKGTREHSMLRRYSAFVRVFIDAGWVWGGDWVMKDDMHFQRAGV